MEGCGAREGSLGSSTAAWPRRDSWTEEALPVGPLPQWEAVRQQALPQGQARAPAGWGMPVGGVEGGGGGHEILGW